LLIVQPELFLFISRWKIRCKQVTANEGKMLGAAGCLQQLAYSLEFRFGTDSKDGDSRDLAANHFLPAWPDTETGPKQINRNASCEMACHVGAKRTGTCRGSARMPPSHSLDIAFRDDHQATRHDSLLCPDTSDQWCIAGLYAGIRRIPTSGVF